VVSQCELAEVAWSGLYYRPRPESDLSLELMRRIDEVYTDYPFFGSRRMTAWLQRAGYPVNRKRIGNLMRQMGL
jgi:putative transposase